jgi:hypothetical protein
MSKIQKLIPAISVHLQQNLIADPNTKLWNPDDEAWGESTIERVPEMVANSLQYDLDYFKLELKEGVNFANFTFKERFGFTGKTTLGKLSPGTRAVYDFCAKNGLQLIFSRVKYSSSDDECYCYLIVKWDHAHIRKLLAQAATSQVSPQQETSSPVNARFFFSTPYACDCGSAAYVLISPGHYGKRPRDVAAMADLLRDKLHAAEIAFSSEEPEIEFGDTEWDKRMMRTKQRIEMDMDPEAAAEALKRAGFMPGLPRRF